MSSGGGLGGILAFAANPVAAIGNLAIGGDAIAGISAANEAEDIARQNNRLAKEQAKEVLRQAKIVSDDLLSEGRISVGNQASAFAAGGVDVSSMTALAVMENQKNAFIEDAFETMRTAQREGRIIRTRAAQELDAAKAGTRAAQISGIADVAMNVASIGMMAPGGFGKTKGMVSTKKSGFGSIGPTNAPGTRTFGPGTGLQIS